MYPPGGRVTRDRFILPGGRVARDRFILPSGRVARDRFILPSGWVRRDRFILHSGRVARDRFILPSGRVRRDRFILPIFFSSLNVLNIIKFLLLSLCSSIIKITHFGITSRVSLDVKHHFIKIS